jgi:hypothetical protein
VGTQKPIVGLKQPPSSAPLIPTRPLRVIATVRVANTASLLVDVLSYLVERITAINSVLNIISSKNT